MRDTGASGTSGSTAANDGQSYDSANGLRGDGAAGMTGSTSVNGVYGTNPSELSGGTAAAGATANSTQDPDAQANDSPQPLVQNNARNQMQNQLQNQTGLVDVNLNNVKVDVARNLNIDASKIPVTVQLPVTAAANVCGVDVNALAAQKQQGGGKPTCTANNANEATQAVQTSVQ